MVQGPAAGGADMVGDDGRCEMLGCICGGSKPGLVRVTDASGGAPEEVRICAPVAKLLRVREGDALPPADKVRAKINAVKRGRQR